MSRRSFRDLYAGRNQYRPVNRRNHIQRADLIRHFWIVGIPPLEHVLAATKFCRASFAKPRLRSSEIPYSSAISFALHACSLRRMANVLLQ